jgi:hypothetical protein
MSTGITIAILAVVIVILLAVALATGLLRSGGRTGGLQRRFGPEYDRAVARHGGDTPAARQELQERVDKHGDLRERPVSEQQLGQYTVLWTRIQEEFVDSPAAAVAEAAALVDRVVHDRGYPDAKSGEQFEALSVHRPNQVQGYRDLRTAAERAREGGGSTEELREILVRARSMFDDLVKPGRQDDRPDTKASEHRSNRFHLRAPHGGGA